MALGLVMAGSGQPLVPTAACPAPQAGVGRPRRPLWDDHQQQRACCPGQELSSADVKISSFFGTIEYVPYIELGKQKIEQVCICVQSP